MRGCTRCAGRVTALTEAAYDLRCPCGLHQHLISMHSHLKQNCSLQQAGQMCQLAAHDSTAGHKVWAVLQGSLAAPVAKAGVSQVCAGRREGGSAQEGNAGTMLGRTVLWMEAFGSVCSPLWLV